MMLSAYSRASSSDILVTSSSLRAFSSPFSISLRSVMSSMARRIIGGSVFLYCDFAGVKKHGFLSDALKIMLNFVVINCVVLR